MITTYIIVGLIAYLLGSIPFGYILVRVFRKQDIRETGSGNIGATNVARTGAKGLAVATLFLDAAKGAAASIVGARLWIAMHTAQIDSLIRGGRVPYIDCWLCTPVGHLAMFAALMAVIGHMFPIWLGFRGGKGVATALGGLAILPFAGPFAVLVCLVVFGLVLSITRYVSLGSMIAAAIFPAAFVVFEPSLAFHNIWPVLLISVLVIARHHANIRRLLAGTEPKLGAKAVPPPQEVERQA